MLLLLLKTLMLLGALMQLSCSLLPYNLTPLPGCGTLVCLKTCMLLRALMFLRACMLPGCGTLVCLKTCVLLREHGDNLLPELSHCCSSRAFSLLLLVVLPRPRLPVLESCWDPERSSEEQVDIQTVKGQVLVTSPSGAALEVRLSAGAWDDIPGQMTQEMNA
jgi:hypothetical protein